MGSAFKINGLRFGVYGLILLLWEVSVHTVGDSARVPFPSGVLQSMVEKLASGQLFSAVGQSLSRILVAVLFAAIVGVIIGIAIGRFRPVARGLSPIINALRSIAPIAWIPMAVLWFGINGAAAIFIVAYAAVFPVILNTAEAARNTDRRLINAAATLGASRRLILVSVVLRAALPQIITGTRIAMGFAWASIVAAELAMGIKLETGGKIEAGLGQLMVSTLYLDRDVNGLVVYMFIIGVIGILIDRGLRWMHRRTAPWEYA